MLKIIRNLLLGIVNNIDSGNSDISNKEALELVSVLQAFTDKEVRLSKYQACQYLNISRASFDNYVRSGKLPVGLKQAGFKEKFWTKKSLDLFKMSRNKQK